MGCFEIAGKMMVSTIVDIVVYVTEELLNGWIGEADVLGVTVDEEDLWHRRVVVEDLWR